METLKPKLRFPEFKGNWKVDKLGDLFDISAGGDIKQEFVSQIRTDIFKYPIYANAEKNKGFYGYASIYKIDLEVITIAGRGVNIGIAHSRKEKFYPIVRLLVLKPKKETSVDFFEYAINNFDIVVESTGVPQLTAPQISNYEIFYSDFKEQTKIANFLSAVDEKLNLLKEKKSLLEEYKKGIMQKIFNQELRFKDDNGNDFGDWEEKLFKEVFSFRSTNSFSRDKLNYFEGKVKNIHYGDIHTKFKTLFDIQNENVPFINSDLSIEKIPLDNYLKVGDLVIADASEDYDDIGKSIEIINLRNTKVLAGLHTFIARPFDNVLSIGFIGFLMKSDDIKLQIKIMAQGTKVLSLSATRFAEIKFSLPCLKEQTKIANFLSAIDEKIALVSNQIEDTQEYKKGLLQQMFV